MREINLEKDIAVLKELNVGEWISISGVIYAARDQACKRLSEILIKGFNPPITLSNSLIYHTGPSPINLCGVCSAGPTTSVRMDPFVEILLSCGVIGFIGKGKRSKEIIEHFKKYKGIYLVTVGGAGAYLGSRIEKIQIVAFEDLGPEAVYYLEVKDFPAMVAIDSKGRSFWN
ncbi:MAG TPA: FumA C-terminus/TtdB family hydratase beta subunit [Dictyoglomaceae bacterium]|nr:FumA C-terminus/TtdB family hydratase beta subunit [Dictyoglomaceae bacterium]